MEITKVKNVKMKNDFMSKYIKKCFHSTVTNIELHWLYWKLCEKKNNSFLENNGPTDLEQHDR